MKITTNKQFTEVANGIRKNLTVIKADTQAMFDYAFSQFEEHGNLTFLTRIRQLSSTSRALPTKQIQRYVVKHANVKWNAEAKRFEKSGKTVKVKERTEKWYDFEAETHHEPKDMDVKASINALMNRIQKRKDEGKVTDTKYADKALAELATLVA